MIIVLFLYYLMVKESVYAYSFITCLFTEVLPKHEMILLTAKRYNCSFSSSIDLIFTDISFSSFHKQSHYIFKT